jgi:phosphatidylglycerophosphatase A
MGEHKQKIPRPLASLILGTPEHLIAFGFGTGLAPYAPGTFGTLVGLPFFFLLWWLPLSAYLVAVLMLFIFGCWVCDRSAKLLGVHDYGGIVFDEVVGFLVACLPLLHPLTGPLWAWLLAAFAAFRCFDILKPWPINVFDRTMGGGFGIMVDDLVAGLYAAAVLLLAQQVLVIW